MRTRPRAPIQAARTTCRSSRPVTPLWRGGWGICSCRHKVALEQIASAFIGE
ncbi:hypothetical protein GLA29479_2960 [Lysobacter antibioticus]|nr:hypothetical protein GLA29479_2960 [Lysobacter antibioticus]